MLKTRMIFSKAESLKEPKKTRSQLKFVVEVKGLCSLLKCKTSRNLQGDAGIF